MRRCEMKDENGEEMPEKQILKECMDLMGNVCCLLFETDCDEAHAAAFMADTLLKYITVIYREDNILLAAADYNGYEEGVYLRDGKHSYLREGKHLRTIK